MSSVTLVAPDGVTTRSVSTYAELEHYLQARGYVPQSGTVSQAFASVTGIDPSTPPVLPTPGSELANDPALRAAFGLSVAATVSASGALVAGNHNPVDATGAATAMTLPTGQGVGATISVEKVDPTTNAVSVTGNIRGVPATTITLPWQHETLLLRADSTGSWWPVAGHKTKATLDAAYALTLADHGDFDPTGNYARGDVTRYNGGRYSAAQAGSGSSTTTTRTNFLPNPRLASNRAGWSVGSNASATVDNTLHRVLLSISGTITIGSGVFLSPNATTNAGDNWAGSMRVSVPAGGTAVTLRASLTFTPTPTTSNGSMITVQPGTSAALTVTGTCPAGRTAVLLSVQAGTGGLVSGNSFYVDQPILEKASSVGTYFDGSAASAGNTTYAWTGTADNSASTAATTTVTSSLGVPGAQGSSWNLLAPATRPTRTALTAAFTPATTTHTSRMGWLCSDRATLLSQGSPTLSFSRNEAVTWTAAHTFTDTINFVAEAGDGEILAATLGTYASLTPFDLWRSTGWATNPTTATWTKVLTGTSPMAAPVSWSWSSYGSMLFVAEYGPKEGTVYNGQTVLTGGNARYVWVSYDYGRTWSVFFDLNSWLTANGTGTTTGCHLHGVTFDPYWDRVWITHGDDRNEILYSDDMGATWQAAQIGDGTGGLYQSVGIVALPQCVLFASDGPPNGVARISRTQGKHAGTYTMENAFSLNTSTVLTHLCHTNYKAPRPGDDAPVVFSWSPDVVAGNSRIVSTVDGYTFNDLWTDPAAASTAGVLTAFGPTVRGNLIADNPSTGFYIIGAMPAY